MHLGFRAVITTAQRCSEDHEIKDVKVVGKFYNNIQSRVLLDLNY